MIRLDTKIEDIYMQFTGARPRTLGYRKFEKVMGHFLSDSCTQSPALGKPDGIRVQAVKEGSAQDGDPA